MRDVYDFMRCSSNCLMEIMTFEIGFSFKPATKANINRYPAADRHPIRLAAVLRLRRRVPGPGWLRSRRQD